jgi:hypothetical protein
MSRFSTWLKQGSFVERYEFVQLIRDQKKSENLESQCENDLELRWLELFYDFVITSLVSRCGNSEHSSNVRQNFCLL